ncbi:MAG: FAD-dependent oxidoreductase [Rhodobacteraceae bacterium]|nr:MAG: FAD-dependent oxidoreductase [Paracoccaceae bacterium]
MSAKGLQVAVIGGGIGGMAVAAALARRGARVTLHEQAGDLAEVGAGLQVSWNGQQVLRALGAVPATGLPPEEVSLSPGTWMMDGPARRRVAFVPPPGPGQTWYMHRADLLARLVDRARAAGVTLKLGQVATPGSVAGDLIVAADGGRSLWRSAIDGPVEPVFSGQVAWRALVPNDKALPTAPATLAMGPRAHMVVYPLRAGRLTNIVAVEERSHWTEEDWNQQGDPVEFRDRFADVARPFGDLLARVDKVHRWALHLRPVARTWVQGNLALLGDAAHPTLPFMAQGACLALEDAWVLAARVDALGVAPGLAAYQAARIDRARRVVALARGNAWRFHLGRPWSWGAQAVLAVGAGALARRLDWVYGYDATRA